jgi:hypothetical protein
MDNIADLLGIAQEAIEAENAANDIGQQEAEDELRAEEASKFRDIEFTPSSDLLSALNLSQVDWTSMTVRHLQLELKTVVERQGLAIPVSRGKRFIFVLDLKWSKLVGRAGKTCLHKAIYWLEMNSKLTRIVPDDPDDQD